MGGEHILLAGERDDAVVAGGEPVRHLAHRRRRQQDIVGGGDHDRAVQARGRGIDAVGEIWRGRR